MGAIVWVPDDEDTTVDSELLPDGAEVEEDWDPDAFERPFNGRVYHDQPAPFATPFNGRRYHDKRSLF